MDSYIEKIKVELVQLHKIGSHSSGSGFEMINTKADFQLLLIAFNH